MLAKQLSPDQQAFVNSITGEVNTLLGTQLPGKFEMVSYPPGFHPTVQYGASAYYNSTMLDAFNGALEIGSNGMLTLGNHQFSTLYNSILTNAQYQYSTADQQTVNNPLINAAQVNVVNAGTSSGFVAAYSVTPVTYGTIISAVLKNFSAKATDWSTGNIAAAAQSLPNAGYASLGSAITTALQKLSPLNTILGAQALANDQLTAAMDHTKNPSAANGGLQIDATDFYVGWTPMPDSTQLLSELANDGSSVSVNIKASNFSSSSATFHISGSAGFTIPVFDVFDIGLSGGSSYDWSKYTSSSSSLDVTMEYKGVTIVQIDPLTLNSDMTKGWYDEMLLQSIKDGSGNPDVSGFKIDSSNQYAPDKMFGQGKPFSRFKTLVVSQAPTISMTFSADQASEVTSQFKENSSVDVKLFGLFKVGSMNQSYSITKVDKSSASGTVTVTMSPPEIQGNIPPEKQVCFVLGGVAQYPIS
ncbi:MAG: hypothetical protein VX248_16405 [Pseudomonadota bacterium]|nr:hypothetical protein [Pseudomonadota bacterium]